MTEKADDCVTGYLMTETTVGLTIRYLTIKQVEQATRLTGPLTDWRPSF